MTSLRRTWGARVAQGLGLLLGAGLLAWCVWMASRPENREHLDRLRHADPRLLVALAALSLLSLWLNGTGFWVTSRPIARISYASVLATNALASLLGFFPFKLSILSRVLVHHRRDGVDVLRIGAWLGASAVIALGVLVPMGAAGLWRGSLDAWFIVGTLAGLALSAGVLNVLGRCFGGEAGRARLAGGLARVGLGAAARSTRHGWIGRLAASMDVVARPGTLAGAMALRMGDLLTQAARFVVAASITQANLPPEKAVPIAAVHFLIGVASPSGAAGSREGGAAAFVKLLPGVDHGAFSIVVLTVGASELVVTGVLGLAALGWLRPDRLMRAGASGPAN